MVCFAEPRQDVSRLREREAPGVHDDGSLGRNESEGLFGRWRTCIRMPCGRRKNEHAAKVGALRLNV